MLVLGDLDLYGAKERTIGSEPVLELRDSGLIQRLGPDLVRILRPAASPMTTGKPLDLDITFPRSRRQGGMRFPSPVVEMISSFGSRTRAS